MTNKSEFTKENDENIIESSQNNIETESDENNQGIFDSQFSELTNQFGKICEDNSINVAYMVAYDIKSNKKFVFMLGHQYDVACIMNKITNEIKNELHNMLEN